MATASSAIHSMGGPAGAQRPQDARNAASKFNPGLAIGYALVGVAAFSGTYWLQLPRGTFIGAPILHLHGLLFTAWLVLLISQTTLVQRRKVALHRGWGMVGIALATAMTFTAFAAAINTLALNVGRHGDAARSAFILPLSAITDFAILFTAAMLNLRRPEWHKRLMFGATVAVLEAAMARFGFYVSHGVGPGMRPALNSAPQLLAFSPVFLLGDLLLLPPIIYDWRVRGRPHPAYLCALAVMVSIQLVRVPIANSQAWFDFANFMLRFGG